MILHCHTILELHPLITYNSCGLLSMSHSMQTSPNGSSSTSSPKSSFALSCRSSKTKFASMKISSIIYFNGCGRLYIFWNAPCTIECTSKSASKFPSLCTLGVLLKSYSQSSSKESLSPGPLHSLYVVSLPYWMRWSLTFANKHWTRPLHLEHGQWMSFKLYNAALGCSLFQSLSSQSCCLIVNGEFFFHFLLQTYRLFQTPSISTKCGQSLIKGLRLTKWIVSRIATYQNKLYKGLYYNTKGSQNFYDVMYEQGTLSFRRGFQNVAFKHNILEWGFMCRVRILICWN